MRDVCPGQPVTAATSVPAVQLAVWLLLVLVGLNLRPFLTAPGPVLQQVQAETGLGNGTAAFLTTLPFLLMGGLALVGPRLARRFGEQTTLLTALMLLATGAGARLLVDSEVGLVLTALLAGTGIASVQALMPGVAKRWFGERTALAMGLYSAAMVGGGALGALVSPWVSSISGDWHPGLAVWGLPVLCAWLLWLWLAPAADDPATTPVSVRRFMHFPRAWLLALFFGLANSGYASLVAWLPLYFQGYGMARQTSGNLMAWMALFQAAGALLMPLLVSGSRDRRASLYAVLILQATGFAGFALLPMSAPALWIAVAGFGLGGSLSLCLTLCLDHLPQARAAGSLAAFMQGVGFLINALGPWIIGVLLDSGGAFETAWWCHAGLVLMLLLVVQRFSPEGYARVLKTP